MEDAFDTYLAIGLFSLCTLEHRHPAKVRTRPHLSGENPFNHRRLQMIKTIQFNLNDKLLSIEVDKERTSTSISKSSIALTAGAGEW